MKKNVFIFMVLVLVIPAVLSAQTPNSPNDLEIENSSLGGVSITRYVGTRTNVVIPSTIDGMRVTEIGNGAFYASNSIRINSVVLPNTLIRIGLSAFENQPLTSITFPASLQEIYSYAFQGCNLTSVIIPNGVKIIGIDGFGSYRGNNDYSGNPISTLVIPSSLASYRRASSIQTREGDLGFSDAFNTGSYGSGTPVFSYISVTLPANIDDRNFDSSLPPSLRDAYKGNGKRAGTYTWTGRIWTVGATAPSTQQQTQAQQQRTPPAPSPQPQQQPQRTTTPAPTPQPQTSSVNQSQATAPAGFAPYIGTWKSTGELGGGKIRGSVGFHTIVITNKTYRYYISGYDYDKSINIDTWTPATNTNNLTRHDFSSGYKLTGRDNDGKNWEHYIYLHNNNRQRLIFDFVDVVVNPCIYAKQ